RCRVPRAMTDGAPPARPTRPRALLRLSRPAASPRTASACPRAEHRLARVSRPADHDAAWREAAVVNRDHWTSANEAHTGQDAAVKWAQTEIAWGLWDVPEHELQALPEVDGLDVVELGCGTAYFSAWLAKRGARPVGVDITPAQLATARELQERT